MASQLPFIFRASPLPSNFKGTPQQLLDAMVARLSAESEVEIAVFVTGSVEPSSNVGPWLKDGTTWYVWDDVSGAYIPQILEQATLQYFVGSTTPDPTVYQFWIQTAVGGEPMALKTYFSGNWTDVYASSLGSYMTVAAFNAAIAAYSTTAQMNTAITNAINSALTNYYTKAEVDALIAGIPTPGNFNSHPGSDFATGQSEAANGGTYGVTGISYIASASGPHIAFANFQFDNGTAVADDVRILTRITVNGSPQGGSGISKSANDGTQWFSQNIQLLNLTSGDTVGLEFTPDDGTGGTVVLTNVDLGAFLLST